MKKNDILLLLFALSFMPFALGQQGTIQLPATGQTTSYYPGDDGDLHTGVTIPANRFINHGNGTATDQLSGLMWVTDGNLMAIRNPSFDQDRIPGDGDTDWQTAMDYIQLLNDENYLGYNDWRAPNVVEMRSFANLGRPDSVLPLGHPFLNIKSLYWTSTTVEKYRSTAIGFFMTEFYLHSNIINVAGETEFFAKRASADYKYYLLPVRSSGNSGLVELPVSGQRYNFWSGDDGGLKAGEPWPSPRLVDNNNETVTDRLTGLMWTMDANLMVTRNPEFDTNQWVDGCVNWQHALDYIALLNSQNYLGYNDWRMPNRNEMTSLIDYSRKDPVLPERFPFTNTSDYNLEYYYWTSTTRADEPDQAWIVVLREGMTGGGNAFQYAKTADWHVWPVRTDNSPLPTASVSGTITLDGNPYQRAEIVLNGVIKAYTRANLNGEYEFTNLPNGNYFITPEDKYTRFTPEFCQVNLNGNPVTCDFTAQYKRAYGWTDISENLFQVGNAAGNYLSDMFFIGQEGWVTSGNDFPEVYHTTNGGETWEVQTSLVPTYAITMLSAEEGYIGGGNSTGMILKTNNGGTNWTFHGITMGKVYDMSFPPGSNSGISCGSDGSWAWINPSGITNGTQLSMDDWMCIEFAESLDYGFMGGIFGRKAWYENGSWTYIGGAMYMPTYNDLHWLNNNLGWFCLSDGIVRRMGATQHYIYRFEEDEGDPLNGIYVLNSDSLWVVTMGGDVLTTVNASADTVHFSSENIAGESLTDIWVTDASHAYAIGGNGGFFRYGLLEGFPAGGADIIDFVVDQQTQPAIINSTEQTIQVFVGEGTDLTQIIPEIFVSAAATINPPGGTMQNFTFPVTYTVTSENGQVIKDWTVTIDITTGVSGHVTPEIILFPNPTRGVVGIQSLVVGQRSVNVKITDLYGNVIAITPCRLPAANCQLDISHLPAGIYFICMSLENQMIVKKIVKL
ncbi:MAG: APHP domain-containing [Bacteroidetes bacterium]|nr:MAG: APHP domain-containing [Bacteroidota bacterium]